MFKNRINLYICAVDFHNLQNFKTTQRNKNHLIQTSFQKDITFTSLTTMAVVINYKNCFNYKKENLKLDTTHIFRQ